jgi:outer membrane protein insertion porin family
MLYKNKIHTRVIGCIMSSFMMLMLLSSCSGLRGLEEGQQLYTGASIHFEEVEPFDEQRNVERELERVLRPKPNSTFLFMRPRLWMYQKAGEPAGKGLRHWMKNRFGEEPVLFEGVDVERNLRLIRNRLYNMGYFDAGLSFRLDTTSSKAHLHYNALLRPPYRFGDIFPVSEDTPMAEVINSVTEESLIITDEPYSLDVLKRERQRINNALKKQGYFYFHPDHMLFRADSSANYRTVDIYSTIKSDKPPVSERQYRIGNIYIHADYLTDASLGQPDPDTLVIDDGLFFFDAMQQFKPKTIARAIFFKKDSIYDIDDHDRSLNHLISLGTFQFVNMRFSARENEGVHYLDVRVLLTPIRRKSLTAEVRGVTRSNNFAGPGISASFTNHNLLKGAEVLKLAVNAAYETLIGRQVSASSREFGLDATLSFPRFVILFNRETYPEVLSPKTNISMGINFMGRTDAFNLTTMNAQYGYVWSHKPVNQFRVSPVAFSLYTLGVIDESIEGILVGGTLLRRGLFEQFVIGGQYSYVYNSRLQPDAGNDWYFHVNLDLSGNLAYLLMHNVMGVSPVDDNVYGLFNQGFAQYTRVDADLRRYFNMGGDRQLVSRLFIGTGFPYGNSDMLPYVKQYVIGGANSVRAFQPRSLGPGSYVPEGDSQAAYNIYHTGELKLEANLEYRFGISGIFKGALFADAGNIWRWKEVEEVPGGQFDVNSFYEQIALGVGTGLRIDAGFFLLRFDFAFPLANPTIDSKGFFDPVHLGRGEWRRDNLVFSLAIGYPF